MRVICHLRAFRGERTLAAIATAIDQKGVTFAELSKLERGIALPRDEWIPQLEHVYGAQIADWYPPQVLLALTGDDA